MIQFIQDTPKGRVYKFYTFDEYRWLRAMGMICEYEPPIKPKKDRVCDDNKLN